MSVYERLFMESKERRLSPEELDLVKAELLDPESTEERYRLLYILGRGGDPSLLPVVEPFLDSPDEPMLARLALEILCHMWDLYDRYRDEIIRFIIGVSWDEDEDVKLMAISCAGSLVQEHPDPELIRLLIWVAESPDEDDVNTQVALRALARATGFAWSDLPQVSAGLPADSDLGRAILAKARALAAASS